MESKQCYSCKVNQPIDNFSRFFQKQRNKFRYSSHCKECARINSKKHYHNNRESKLIYMSGWRNANPEIVEKHRNFYKKKYVAECKEFYLKMLLQRNRISIDVINDNPEILQTKKLSLMIKRKLKSLKNGAKQTN